MRMARPSGAAAAALSALVVLAGLLCSCRGAVFTVDYGSEWIKVAVVSPRLKPDPIAIAINEMSKRKSPALVAISNGERLVSEEAAGIIGRYPERVYMKARDLVGVPLEAAQKMLASSYAGYTITGPPSEVAPEGVPERLRKVWVKTHDGQVHHMGEELVGMLVEYAQHLAESNAKFEVVDAVVSVPPFFSQAQRQALLDSALLVGVNVMALVHEHAGAALQYGMFRAKEGGEGVEKDVLLYDMGGGSTYAALLRFSQYSVKERGKNVTNPQFQVKGVRWDHSLGGSSLEDRLLEHFAVEFNAKMGGSFDVRKHPKSMAKLRKAAKRTKEILSANSEAPISVESLFEENDFRSSIKREKFEELCADLWPRALEPMKQVLQDTGLKVEDLYAVELIGGGTRVPKVQAVLQEFLGPNKTLDRHLDADESVALGAAWLAANLSDGFKLNRKVGMVDGMPYGVLFRVAPLPAAPEPAAVEAQEEALFPRLKKFPLKIIRSLKQEPQADFQLSLLYDEEQGLPPSWPKGTPILTYNVLGVKNATDKYSSYNLTSPLKVSLHFELSRSGIVSLDKAEIVVEFSEWYEVKVPIPSNKTNATATIAGGNSTETEAEGAKKEGADGASEKKEPAAGADSGKEGAGATAAAAGAGVNATEAVKEEEPQFEVKRKLRKRTIRVSLEVVDATEGFQRMMSEGEAKAAQKRIDKLREKEAEKKAVAEAKNALEAYIYATKDKLEAAEDAMLAVSTEEQREAVRSQLVDAEDWLYMDGENAAAAEFKSKLREIQKEPEAIFFRMKEAQERPAAVRHARQFLEDTRDTLYSWADEKPWINKTAQVDPLHEDLRELEKWLGEKEGEQKKLKPHQEPAFTSKSVIGRVTSLRERVTRVEKTPKPKPKKTPPPKSDSKANSTAGNATDTEQPTGEGSSDKKAEHDEL